LICEISGDRQRPEILFLDHALHSFSESFLCKYSPDLIKLREEKGEVVISKEDFEGLISEVESLIETVEILGDENLMKQISGSERDIKEGKVSEIKSTDELRRLFLV